jgi:DNA invertase Pin-like site-specific DNA recombinase
VRFSGDQPSPPCTNRTLTHGLAKPSQGMFSPWADPKTLISALENFLALRIDFVSVTEAVDTSLPAGEMLFQMIGAVAQFERSLIAERVKAGLDHARKNGVVLGRPPLRKLTRKEIRELRHKRIQQKSPFRTLAAEFGVSVWTAHALCRSSKS